MAYKNEVLSQILFADRIVVNKIDLIGGACAVVALRDPSLIWLCSRHAESELKAVRETVRGLNSFAAVAESRMSAVSPRFVLGELDSEATSADGKAGKDSKAASGSSAAASASSGPGKLHPSVAKLLLKAADGSTDSETEFKKHDPAIQSACLSGDGDVVLEDVLAALRRIVQRAPDDFFRIKGACMRLVACCAMLPHLALTGRLGVCRCAVGERRVATRCAAGRARPARCECPDLFANQQVQFGERAKTGVC